MSKELNDAYQAYCKMNKRLENLIAMRDLLVDHELMLARQECDRLKGKFVRLCKLSNENPKSFDP